MAGEAKTSKFMLGTATVMLGPVDELHNLNPADHSIGLVKNFRVQGTPGYTDLTQGVKGQKVFSVMTSNDIAASMEVYEYTAPNLTYALGLEGYDVSTTAASTTVTTAATAVGTSLTVAAIVGFSNGDWIAIDLGNDNVIVRRLSAAPATNSLTVSQALGQAVPQGAVVRKLAAVDIGSKEDQPFLAAKVVGVLADGTKVTLLCPKIRVTNGFSVGFTTDNFDNMPYEWSFYDLVSTDPFFSEFNGVQARMFANA